MESSTSLDRQPEPSRSAPYRALFENWEQIEQALPFDLEETARQAAVLQRKREIRNATDYLRLALMYGVSDWSLRLLGAWAVTQNIGYLSDVAVLKRLCASGPWLGMLVGKILQQRCDTRPAMPSLQLRLQDATAISKPGSQGTDWRVHLSLTLWPFRIDGIEVTDAHTGENLNHFEPGADEIRVADRAYAFARSLDPLLVQSARFVVRANWHQLPLETTSGERLDILAWLKTLTAPSEQEVYLVTSQGRFGLRLLASPLDPKQAEKARKRVRRRDSKRSRKVSPESWLAAGFLVLLTNLPVSAWPFEQVCWLYRLRWQIEVAIKRLKSLLQLDHLRAKDPQLVQAYLLSKLLAALILDELIQQVALHQPDWFISLQQPVSLWRLTHWFWDSLRQLIFGRLDLARFFQVLPALNRYFCDSPRTRPQQLAWARAFLDYKSGCLSFFSC